MWKTVNGGHVVIGVGIVHRHQRKHNVPILNSHFSTFVLVVRLYACDRQFFPVAIYCTLLHRENGSFEELCFTPLTVGYNRPPSAVNDPSVTETIQQWSAIGAMYDSTNWSSGCHMENKLIRCDPSQLRRYSEREVSIASLKGLVQV